MVAVGALAFLFVTQGDGAGREADVPPPDPSASAEASTAVPTRPPQSRQAGELTVTHGVASGDVSATGASLWARASGRARMHVEVARNQRFRNARRRVGGIAVAEHDFAVTVRVTGLRPFTLYHYRIHFADPRRPSVRSNTVAGRFRTAPAPAQSRAVRFFFGADIGSSGYCRHERFGYPIFAYMASLRTDFFVALGDMVYADRSCPRHGENGWVNLPGDFPAVDDRSVDWNDRARVREIYFKHWRYTRADHQLANFLSRTPMYSIWDDHEVMNDFGASWDRPNAQYSSRPGFRNLVDAGRRALFAYGVLNRRRREPNRLYRFYRLGKHLQLFLLDTRSYRSRNEQRDDPGAGKTLLGRAQLAWLKRSLASSTATWKVVATSVPVSVPTGNSQFGRDGWADGESGNGFERELLDLLAFLDRRNVKNLVFITGDLHFPQGTRNARDYDGDRDSLTFHELVAGPLNAQARAPYGLDVTTSPTLLYDEANFFNFGAVEIIPRRGGKATLWAKTYDSFGKVRPRSVVRLEPS